MYHIQPRQQKREINYHNIVDPTKILQKPDININDMNVNGVPDAPQGFTFYRVKRGDTLIALSVKYGVSQSKIQRFNKKVCFGHRLAHLHGKLLLIPLNAKSMITKDVENELKQIYKNEGKTEGNNNNDNDNNEQKSVEPDDNGKYQLKKALMFYGKDLTDIRAEYYLKESNWNLRDALKKWKNDDRWEQEQKKQKKAIKSKKTQKPKYSQRKKQRFNDTPNDGDTTTSINRGTFEMTNVTNK
mmetsp:Transcript_24250/g.29637  ORF Transcript_24250/g.29637 Transcript_24250/m.29637 type:complete len:243 (-) Transcript_24250:176-904(-)